MSTGTGLAASSPPRPPSRREGGALCIVVVCAVLAFVMGWATEAAAGAKGIRAHRVEAGAITLDGIPGEWNAGMFRLTETVQGKGQDGKPDLAAEATVGYDDDYLYVGLEVVDDHFKPGGDRATLTLGFAGGKTHSVAIVPGNPGKSPGRALNAQGGAIKGAEVVEAPVAGGYSLEAKIPWSAFPSAKTVRVGLRGAIVVHDTDTAGSVEAAVGNTSKTSYADLPAFTTAAEQAMSHGLLKKKSVPNKPKFNLLANVAGDGMKERVMIFGSYLVVLGPKFKGGTQYYWNDMNLPDLHLAVVECTPRDVTGDGRDDLVLRKRFGKAKRWREVLQIMTFGDGETPKLVLEHETALQSETGAIDSRVSFLADGAKKAIQFEPGASRGYSAENYNEQAETAFEPLLLPWGTIESQLYKFQGGSFVKSLEKTRSAPASAGSSPKPPKPAPASKGAAPAHAPAPSSGELQSQVYASYKTARSVTDEPRFSLSANVAGDATKERVLLHDRDLVVFGPGYQSGKGYAFSTLTGFADAKDIDSVKTKDVTGDGKEEILVRGKLRSKAPAEAGGGEVERQVILVYQVRAEKIVRVFAAELSRSIGAKSVTGSISFGGGKPATITLSPGKAVGWTEGTYPFNQDTGPVGGFEPLLLPWGGAQPTSYRFSGTVFER